MTTLGGYVRHRDRMVTESVYEDLLNTLIACRWTAGTTSRPVISPYDPEAGAVVVTTNAPPTPPAPSTPNDVLPLLEGNPVVLIDYFPEAEGDNLAGVVTSGKTAPNTLALDIGQPQDSLPLELGSNATEQPYLFNLAFFATSDAVASAVLNDLRDRYLGRIVRDDTIDLYDYNAGGQAPVVRMDVETFRFTRDTTQVAQHEVHLYFAELTVTDFVDAA